jgi:cation transport protein ChaC
MRLTAAHLAVLPKSIPDPGPMAFETGGPPSDAYYQGATRDIMTAAAGRDVWLFAFGSLIWNKRFTHVEERPGVARGWHRDFCLGPDTRFRGNPAAPGYTLSLDRGGQCKGMVYRFPDEGLAANIEGLLRKEPPWPPTWVTVVTAEGLVRAFAFTIPSRKFPGYAGHLSDDVVADALASAVGMWGTMAEYVLNTAQHLEDLGLCDDRLWRMQEMVAERIERSFPQAFDPSPRT